MRGEPDHYTHVCPSGCPKSSHSFVVDFDAIRAGRLKSWQPCRLSRPVDDRYLTGHCALKTPGACLLTGLQQVFRRCCRRRRLHHHAIPNVIPGLLLEQMRQVHRSHQGPTAFHVAYRPGFPVAYLSPYQSGHHLSLFPVLLHYHHLLW